MSSIFHELIVLSPVKAEGGREQLEVGAGERGAVVVVVVAGGGGQEHHRLGCRGC